MLISVHCQKPDIIHAFPGDKINSSKMLMKSLEDFKEVSRKLLPADKTGNLPLFERKTISGIN